MKNESGRSMVEMLGVLAIIGVLSIGGIAGYTLAMNRYRANEIMDTAAKLAIVAMSSDAGRGETVNFADAGLGTELPAGVTSMSAYANGLVTIAYENDTDKIQDLVKDFTNSNSANSFKAK